MIARSASIRAFTRRDGVRLVAIGLLIIVALGAILAVDALPGFGASNGIVDGVATVDIRAPRALTYTSAVSTEQRREEVRQQVPPQYDYTADRAQTITDQQLTAFDVAVSPVDAAYTAVLDDTARQSALRAAIPALTTAAQDTLAALNQVQWTALRGEMTRVLESTERQEVRDTLLADVRGSIANRVNTRFSPDQRALAGEILAPLTVANSTYDATATERAREDAANRVDPIEFSVRKGEVLVSRGQAIDPLAQEKLAAFGLLDPQPDAARAGGWLLLAALTIVPFARLDLALPAPDLAPHASAVAHRARANRDGRGDEGDRRPLGAAICHPHCRRGTCARGAARRRRGVDRHGRAGANRRRDRRQRRVRRVRPAGRDGGHRRHPPR